MPKPEIYEKSQQSDKIRELQTQLPSMNHKILRTNKQKNSYLQKNEQIYMSHIIQNFTQQIVPKAFSPLAWSARSFLINKTVIWHRLLKLNKFVLFQTIGIIDQYILVKNKVENEDLLIIASLFLSQKHHLRRRKIILPNWLKQIGLNYQPHQIIQMEMNILQQLDFNIQIPNSLQLMLLIISQLNLQQKTVMLSRYFLEISTLLISSHPQHQAIVAICSAYLAIYFLEPQSWDNSCYEKLHIDFSQIEKCNEIIFDMVVRAPIEPFFQAIYKKFMKKCYLEVSTIQFRNNHQKQNQQSIIYSEIETSEQDQPQTQVEYLNTTNKQQI